MRPAITIGLVVVLAMLLNGPASPERTHAASILPASAHHEAQATLTATLVVTSAQTSAPLTLTPTPALTASVPAVEPTSKTPQPAYRYLPIGAPSPDLSQPCPGCPRAPGYIVGRIVDAAGQPLAGVRLVCYNDWHRYPVVGSKGGGEYDFPILQAQATWYVVVLDEADQPLSPEAPVDFDPLEACWYRLDWQRVD